MFPVLLIAIGVAVLAVGARIAVLGAAVGALLGIGLLRLLPSPQDSWLMLAIPSGLAVLGAVGARFMKGIIHILTIVMGAVGGAAIVLGFLDLFTLNSAAFDWVLALIGGGIGVMLVRRFKRWALIVLAGLVGALLTMRGLTNLWPALHGPVATLLALALAGGSIAFQGGLLHRRKHEATAAPATAATPAAPASSPTTVAPAAPAPVVAAVAPAAPTPDAATGAAAMPVTPVTTTTLATTDALAAPTTPEPDLAEQLERVTKLHGSGALTDEEFAAAKQIALVHAGNALGLQPELLNERPPDAPAMPTPAAKPAPADLPDMPVSVAAAVTIDPPAGPATTDPSGAPAAPDPDPAAKLQGPGT